MSATKTETMPVAKEKHHITFFRQSGWMMFAATTSGALMYAVHPIVTRGLPPEIFPTFTVPAPSSLCLRRRNCAA